MPEFEWYNLPWVLFDEAQRHAVLDHGYESPEWCYVRRLAEVRLAVWHGDIREG